MRIFPTCHCNIMLIFNHCSKITRTVSQIDYPVCSLKFWELYKRAMVFLRLSYRICDQARLKNYYMSKVNQLGATEVVNLGKPSAFVICPCIFRLKILGSHFNCTSLEGAQTVCNIFHGYLFTFFKKKTNFFLA